MRAKTLLLTTLLALTWTVASAQDSLDCPDYAFRDDEGECQCYDGYVFSEPDLACRIEECQDNAERPPGQELNPFGCACLRGFVKAEDSDECAAVEPCDGDNQVRTGAGECVCPEDSTEREDGSGCDCDEGFEYSDEYGRCAPLELQCPLNSTRDDFDNCVCDEGYGWDPATLGCEVIVSECGPHASPAEGGTGCVCEEGFHPAPPGTLGCVGEIRIRCQPNAHENPDTGECECNPGYPETASGQCVREGGAVVVGGPIPGVDDGLEPPIEEGRSEPRALCAVGGPGRTTVGLAPTWLGLLALLGLARRRRKDPS